MYLDAPVAQWIEHRPPEPRVGGSNPLRRASSQSSGPLAQLVEQLTLNQRVAGSNPARLTIIYQGVTGTYTVYRHFLPFRKTGQNGAK